MVPTVTTSCGVPVYGRHPKDQSEGCWGTERFEKVRGWAKPGLSSGPSVRVSSKSGSCVDLRTATLVLTSFGVGTLGRRTPQTTRGSPEICLCVGPRVTVHRGWGLSLQLFVTTIELVI